MQLPAARTDPFWMRVIAIVSTVVVLAVAFLILGPRPAGTHGRLDVTALPHVNAALNAASAILLVVAYALIRRGRIERHRDVMLLAFGTSSLFLVSYVVYHWFKLGPRPYEGDWRGLYFAILASHIVLAAAIVPLALVTLYRGWTMQVPRHRKIARLTLPLWLYVSVTGVWIYLLLY